MIKQATEPESFILFLLDIEKHSLKYIRVFKIVRATTDSNYEKILPIKMSMWNVNSIAHK